MRKITVAIILVGLVFASLAGARTTAHQRPSRAVLHRKHGHERRKHPHHRRHRTRVRAHQRRRGAKIGVGDPPGCLRGANPTKYLRRYGATVVRIVLSPYYGAPGTHGQAIPCLKAARAHGARVEIAIQWRSVWSPAQTARFVRKQLALYARYVWAVGLGNEQELSWGLPGHLPDPQQTPAQYVSDWNAAEPILARMARHAVRVAVEGGPWSFPFTQQVLADGLHGSQALAVHPYTVPLSYPNVGDFHKLAASHGLPLWCTEGLAAPGAVSTPRLRPQSLAKLSVCKVAVVWLK